VKPPFPELEIFGARLSLLDKHGLLAAVRDYLASGGRYTIASGNAFCFNLAYEQPWLAEFLNRADIVRLEGDGLRLGAWLLGHATPRRIVFADFVWELAALADEQRWSFFLLGSREGVARHAAERLRARFPELRIAGAEHGYFDRSPGSAENAAVVQRINAARPDALFVGFGMPLQERWLCENRDRLEVPVVFTCGALFDFISGRVRRAPRWMTEHGLEWLGRLIAEPGRLWRRYVIGNPLFVLRVIRQRLR
jgi:N-acetylglucosaminyldiphosphoundecaprenol N-acetyl-beta-D-mannosaminyltransferase